MPIPRSWRGALAAVLVFGTAATGAAADHVESGDPARGETVYQRCAGCHSLTRNRAGPKHCGLIGRRAGSVEGFRYSRAMRESAIVWTPESLERFLADPPATVPGTRMGYAGVKDAQDRRDLVAFLVMASRSRDLCPE